MTALPGPYWRHDNVQLSQKVLALCRATPEPPLTPGGTAHCVRLQHGVTPDLIRSKQNHRGDDALFDSDDGSTVAAVGALPRHVSASAISGLEVNMSMYISRQMLNSDSHQQKVAERPGIIYRLSRSVLRKWRRRRLIAALEALDERLLRDIGIERARLTGKRLDACWSRCRNSPPRPTPTGN